MTGALSESRAMSLHDKFSGSAAANELSSERTCMEPWAKKERSMLYCRLAEQLMPCSDCRACRASTMERTPSTQLHPTWSCATTDSVFPCTLTIRMRVTELACPPRLLLQRAMECRRRGLTHLAAASH